MRSFTEELIPTVKSSRELGELTYYDPIRGFGFIRIDQTTNDIFVHYTEIQKVCKCYNIKVGLIFSFDVFGSDKGFQAKNIELVK